MTQRGRFREYQQVKLKHSRTAVSDYPVTQLDIPRAVTTDDRGVIVHFHTPSGTAFIVEFFDDQGQTVDLLDLTEDQVEPYE